MNNSVLKSLWQEEDGQDLVEYSLLLAFIALAAVTVLSQTGTTLNKLWANVSTVLSSSASTAAKSD